MGRKIIIMTVLALFFALTGRGADDTVSVVCGSASTESSFDVIHGNSFSTYALTSINAGSGINLTGSLKNQKHNIHSHTRRFIMPRNIYPVIGRDFTRPISDLTGTFRQLVVLEKFLI